MVFGNDWGANMFGAVLVVDEIGQIVDLGKKSCKEMLNTYEQDGEYRGPGHGGYPHKEDRTHAPMFWLIYSEALYKLQRGEGSNRVAAKKNHCYLMYKSSTSHQVVVAFHVKELVKDQSVVLDEIEVFMKAEVLTAR